MQQNELKVIINRPIDEVFAFTTNPKNTPKWIDGVAEEISSDFPPKLGTAYKNRGGG